MISDHSAVGGPWFAGGGEWKGWIDFARNSVNLRVPQRVLAVIESV